MKARAAAIAAVVVMAVAPVMRPIESFAAGWYWMVPQPERPVPEQPVHSWTFERATETAAECEQLRALELDKATRDANQALNVPGAGRSVVESIRRRVPISRMTPPQRTAAVAVMRASRVRESRCVASDDPALRAPLTEPKATAPTGPTYEQALYACRREYALMPRVPGPPPRPSTTIFDRPNAVEGALQGMDEGMAMTRAREAEERAYGVFVACMRSRGYEPPR